MIQLSEADKDLHRETAKVLKGSERRVFMARVVKRVGHGGASYMERELGWNRRTIRKGMRELETGVRCLDNFGGRGRKRAEEHLPNLVEDMKAIVDSQSQTDPTFRTNRLYTRISAREVHQQLIGQKGYTAAELPSIRTIGKKLNEMGYRLRQVLKSKPEKTSRDRCHLRTSRAGQFRGGKKLNRPASVNGCQSNCSDWRILSWW